MTVFSHDQAFPIPADVDHARVTGLTKRELFAAMALQGILANSHYEPPRRKKLDAMAEDAVGAAEALIDQLAKS
jgi:hypothetical protein